MKIDRKTYDNRPHSDGLATGGSGHYAKITEDDGTARDKVMRIQHLGELSLAGHSEDDPKYEVIACIGDRGFGVRREDMKKMILATRGKVFTAQTLGRIVECTRLKEFKTR